MRVVEIRKTYVFARWLDALRDLRGRARVQARIARLATGNAGDVAAVGGGVSELRIHFGPGYRVYFVRRGKKLVILLAGGARALKLRTSTQPNVSHVNWRTNEDEQNENYALRCGRAPSHP
ncbi:MAG: putative addiction module killer protein [Hyphomicrobiaceae bacterium]